MRIQLFVLVLSEEMQVIPSSPLQKKRHKRASRCSDRSASKNSSHLRGVARSGRSQEWICSAGDHLYHQETNISPLGCGQERRSHPALTPGGGKLSALITTHHCDSRQRREKRRGRRITTRMLLKSLAPRFDRATSTSMESLVSASVSRRLISSQDSWWRRDTPLPSTIQVMNAKARPAEECQRLRIVGFDKQLVCCCRQ